MVHLALLDHVLHQCQRFRRDGERGEAGGKPGHAQDAHRVFGEGVCHMAQHLVGQVLLTTVGVDEAGALRLLGIGQGHGHGVDGEVAAGEIVFERDARPGVHRKALVAGRGFSLQTGQRVFLARVRVQKHGEVAPHRQVAQVEHGLRRGAHHDPVSVAVGGRAALGGSGVHQGVAHRAAHEVNVHAGSVGPGLQRPNR